MFPNPISVIEFIKNPQFTWLYTFYISSFINSQVLLIFFFFFLIQSLITCLSLVNANCFLSNYFADKLLRSSCQLFGYNLYTLSIKLMYLKCFSFFASLKRQLSFVFFFCLDYHSLCIKKQTSTINFSLFYLKDGGSSGRKRTTESRGVYDSSVHGGGKGNIL